MYTLRPSPYIQKWPGVSTTRLALAASSRCGKGEIKKIKEDKAVRERARNPLVSRKTKQKKRAIYKDFVYMKKTIVKRTSLEVDPNGSQNPRFLMALTKKPPR
ncbi:hypothetical protein Leryth_024570 [Lithospermum erythrorhizon]|nr:hypothetical protein Leryth_024570 [Lithospermum erythrorhizon]